MKGSIAAAFLLACIARIAVASTTMLPFVQIASTDRSGHAVLNVAAGQVGASVETFDSTSLERATTANASLVADASDIYAEGSARSTFFLLRQRFPQLDDLGQPFMAFPPKVLIAELVAGTTPGVVLIVGADRNGDAKPQADEVLCQSEFAATGARCVLGPDILQGSNQVYWVMAAAPSGAGATCSAILSGALPSVPKLLGDPFSGFNGPLTSLSARAVTVTGPGRAEAGAPFPLRVTWVQGEPAPQRYYGAILVGSGALTNLIDDATAMLPYVLVRPVVPDNSAHPIAVAPVSGIVYGYYNLQPGESQRRIFFDLPPRTSAYDPIQVFTSALLQDPTNIEFSAVRTDFPASASDPVIAEAPLDAPSAATWNALNYSGVITQPTSGRWFITAKNKTSAPLTVVIGLGNALNNEFPYDFARGATPTIAAGQYFNPQRSGHGISVSQAAGQQLLFWYSYLEDGTPAWYIAQAAAPAAGTGWWTSPLYRVAWNGSAGTPTQVGTIELTPTATNRFMFTWQLEGEQGSEAFELLAAADACVGVGADTASLSGNWFAPAQAGYGVDVLTRPDQQFDLVYFYDRLGLARWGIGSNGPFASSSILTMLQSSGFCPTCAWAPVATQALGTLMMDYSSATNGTLATSFTLQAPLSGSWNVAQPMLRLTGSAACLP